MGANLRTPRGPSERISMGKSGDLSHVECEDHGIGQLYPATTAGELHREISIRTIFILGIGGGIGTPLSSVLTALSTLSGLLVCFSASSSTIAFSPTLTTPWSK